MSEPVTRKEVIEVLHFYAEISNYENYGSDEDESTCPDVINDRGDRARNILNRIRENGKTPQ